MSCRSFTATVLALATWSCGLAEEMSATTVTQRDTVAESGTIGRDGWREVGPFEVADGGELEVLLTTMSGDADLYARAGQAPTWGVFDCRPYLGGVRPESCHFDGPATVYLAVAGYARTSEYELTVEVTAPPVPPPSTCGNATLDDGELCDGKPRECSAFDPEWVWGSAPCLADCSGWDESACNLSQDEYFADSGTLPAGRWRHYAPFNTLPGEVRAVLSGTGDADLYVRKSRPPTTAEYDCRSNGAESDEACALAGPGLFYVSVLGYSPTSDYALEVFYPANYTTPQPDVNYAGGDVAAGEWRMFGPYFHGVSEVEIIMAGSGDADLYVGLGAQPTATSFDCRPYASDSNESCHLDLEAPGELWVGVNGWASSSHFELVSVHLPD